MESVNFEINDSAVEKILPKTSNMGWIDHHCNIFKTIDEMCKYYYISREELYTKLLNGYSLEDALEGYRSDYVEPPVIIVRGDIEFTPMAPIDAPGKPMCDHNGVYFPSKEAMCFAHKVPTQIFDRRREQGLNLREALTQKVWYDHHGNAFNNKIEMCKFYNVPVDRFNTRLRKGESLYTALTGEKYTLVTRPE